MVSGNGPLYEVRDLDGAQRRVQTQVDPVNRKFYITKGTGGKDGKSEFEELAWDSDYIYRGLDTSPGLGRFYVQYDVGKTVAKWIPRFMNVSQDWVGSGHWVQFFEKESCNISHPNSGSATNVNKFFNYHETIEFNGLIIADVIHIGKPAGERFWFAKGLGMVGWASDWNESYISEIHQPGQRPDNQKEEVCNYELP